MFISHLVIKNFRALEDIDFDLGRRVNVIVGPNAVGKSTILHAIRLAKAVLAPRTSNETMQVLQSLGAASPHFPQRLFLNNLAREPDREIEIRCTFTLGSDDQDILAVSVGEIVQSIMSARIGQQFQNPAQLIQFMQSPSGVQASAATSDEVRIVLQALASDPCLTLGLRISSSIGITSDDSVAAAIVGHLDRRQPPATTIFSYFPADRALPIGEVNIQVGGPESNQQLESHNSQPQLKYQRLKNLIINEIVVQGNKSDRLAEEFQAIFSGLLRDRKISTIGINEVGLLSVMTEEVSSGRLVELDALSSGEKNVAATFLIIAVSIAPSGIVIFDEPELHLNPAVSREVLGFVMDRYSVPRDIQFIMCTHSTEILSGAFRHEDCVLLHLRSPADISRVGNLDLQEYADAIARLGGSVGESLMYNGTVFVEGESDKEFLELAFSDLLKPYLIKSKGGRVNIEQTILDIQNLESNGKEVSPIYLLFDRDDETTWLKPSLAVRFIQWKRRCLENYLIDIDVITTLLSDSEYTKEPIRSEGSVRIKVRDLALSQLTPLVARRVFSNYGYKSPFLHRVDLEGDIEQISTALFKRLEESSSSLPKLSKEEWSERFKLDTQQYRRNLLPSWERKWEELCDGKELISDLHKSSSMKMSEDSFRTMIVRRMRDTKSRNWNLAREELEKLFQFTSS